jgi:hypothetical protein
MYSIFTYNYLHDWVIYGVNVGVHIPAPWSGTVYKVDLNISKSTFIDGFSMDFP